MCYQSKVNKAVLVHAMKAYGEVKVKFHTLLSSGVDAAKWLGSHTGCFTTGEITPLTT